MPNLESKLCLSLSETPIYLFKQSKFANNSQISFIVNVWSRRVMSQVT